MLGTTKREAGLVAAGHGVGGRGPGGEREVVAAERVLRQVADHRAGLHAEQRGREQPSMLPLSGMPPGKPGSGALTAGSVVVVALLGPHRFAEGGGEGLEHRAQRGEVEIDPALGADGAQRGAEGRGEPGLADHERLRGACAARRTARGRAGRRWARDGPRARPTRRSGGRSPSSPGPGDWSIRITWARSIWLKSKPQDRTGPADAPKTKGRGAGRRDSSGSVELSELRFVGHAVSL